MSYKMRLGVMIAAPGSAFSLEMLRSTSFNLLQGKGSKNLCVDVLNSLLLDTVYHISI